MAVMCAEAVVAVPSHVAVRRVVARGVDENIPQLNVGSAAPGTPFAVFGDDEQVRYSGNQPTYS